MHKATYGAIEWRIHILEERADKDNYAIIKKLKRQLRNMEKKGYGPTTTEEF